MRAQNLVVIAAIISVTVLLTACHKKPVAELLHAAEISHSKAPAKSAKSALNQKDLGVLPLSNHISTTVILGKHKECTITPTLLQGGKLQIILALTTTGDDGKTLGMNVARVLSKPGEPSHVSIGSMNLAFTPQLTKQ